MGNHVARIQFVGIAVRGKNDGGFQGPCPAGGAVSGEMQKGKFFRLAGKERCGGRIFSRGGQNRRGREKNFWASSVPFGLGERRENKGGGRGVYRPTATLPFSAR